MAFKKYKLLGVQVALPKQLLAAVKKDRFLSKGGPVASVFLYSETSQCIIFSILFCIMCLSAFLKLPAWEGALPGMALSAAGVQLLGEAARCSFHCFSKFCVGQRRWVLKPMTAQIGTPWKKSHEELNASVRPVPGECPQALAKRAMVALRRMGYPLPPVSPSGHGHAPPHAQVEVPAAIGASGVPKKPVRPAIGGQRSEVIAAQGEEGSAMGDKIDATKCKAALPFVNEVGHGSHTTNAPAPFDPLAGTSAPWKFYNEENIPFQASRVLGKGTFGEVVGGFVGPSGQAVAMKVLKRSPLQPELDVDIQKEIQSLTDLQHPCIVHFFGVVLTRFNAQLYLRRHQASLHDFLCLKFPRGAVGEMPEADAQKVAACILKGLEHMHANGYVHRDLKPANVLVDSQPLAAVISDLGSAHLGEDARDLATTLTVRAPETMLGDAYLKASDIWSLGCILARLEQPGFFDLLHVDERRLSTHKAALLFMHGLAKKICPRRNLALQVLEVRGSRLPREVLSLGHVEAGVFGRRFSPQIFQPLMEHTLDFHPNNRATAQSLLQHCWLQAAVADASTMEA